MTHFEDTYRAWSTPARIFELATRNLLDIVSVCRRTDNPAFIMSSEICFVRKFSLAEPNKSTVAFNSISDIKSTLKLSSPKLPADNQRYGGREKMKRNVDYVEDRDAICEYLISR